MHEDRTQELLKEAEAIDPHNASAYFEVAEQLGAMRIPNLSTGGKTLTSARVAESWESAAVA